MIVMTYSSSMPFLYVAGFIVFITMYWSDKILFLRHYKNPPLYTKALVVNAIEIMEWGVLLHLIFGAFMVTNPDVFDYKAPDERAFTAPRYAEKLGSWLENVLHVKATRFYSPHGSAYVFASLLIACLFILDKLTRLIFGVAIFSYLAVSCCACFRIFSSKRAWSTNIFQEIRVQDLDHEYKSSEDTRDSIITELLKLTSKVGGGANQGGGLPPH